MTVQDSQDSMAVELPQWLQELRKAEVVIPVREDHRSVHNSLFGLSSQEARNAIERGRASFDEPWDGLSPEDLVLLYAYLNQKLHLEELTEVFRMIFANTAPENPIVVDLGCGPATGGLALAGVLPYPAFDYIGMDSSQTMRSFGERLASRAPQLSNVQRRWISDLASVEWDRAPEGRPVLVIVSYLLASPTLNPEQVVQLVADLNDLLTKLGHGSVTVLYTNSPIPIANQNFPAFQGALEQAGFIMRVNRTSKIVVERPEGDQPRQFQYAEFHRPAKRAAPARRRVR